MALLQISEPGQTPDPHQRSVVVGIDLGTTHSLVAGIRQGVPACLPDAQGRVILPSVVRYLSDGSTQVGHAALAHQASDPGNTISSVKRFMGRSLADIQRPEAMALQFIDQPGMLALQTIQGPKSPVEISAAILTRLRQRAEETLGADLYGAVITVPAYFDDAQRQATKDAAQLAGINVLRLINEPTAAAIAYGLEHSKEGIYAVYDLGGGTFDISILRLSNGLFEVLATGGDSSLGGDDYDRALADWVLQKTQHQTIMTATDLAQMRVCACACKEALSQAEKTLFKAHLGDTELICPVERSEFEQATRNLTARTLQSVRQAMRDARLRIDEVQGVVLVGGSTRMPHIQQAVEKFFGFAPLQLKNPDQVVALGAAVHANQLVGNNPTGELLLLDVIALSLGLETMGGLVERIITRNQTIPIAMSQVFTTFQDGQTALALHVVQGERDLVADCRSLARFELRGIPPMVAGAARIRVMFTVDADGLLTVSATEETSGVQAQIQVKPSYGLNDEQISHMLRDSFASAEIDMKARALVQARLDADRLWLAVKGALEADSGLLSPVEYAEIERQMAMVLEAKKHAEVIHIEQATERLAKATEQFAARRMNRGIQVVLTGKSIEAIE